jgi:hypothetical protein
VTDVPTGKVKWYDDEKGFKHGDRVYTATPVFDGASVADVDEALAEAGSRALWCESL